MAFKGASRTHLTNHGQRDEEVDGDCDAAEDDWSARCRAKSSRKLIHQSDEDALGDRELKRHSDVHIYDDTTISADDTCRLHLSTTTWFALTCELKPRVSIMKKKRTDQTGASGMLAKPSGYTTKIRPGPETQTAHVHVETSVKCHSPRALVIS